MMLECLQSFILSPHPENTPGDGCAVTVRRSALRHHRQLLLSIQPVFGFFCPRAVTAEGLKVKTESLCCLIKGSRPPADQNIKT